MADLGLTECCGESKLRFEIWFRRRKARDLFVLQASNVATKQAWTADISRLLWRQAIHNKGESLYNPKEYMSSQEPKQGHALWKRVRPLECFLQETGMSRALERLGKRERCSSSSSRQCRGKNVKFPLSIRGLLL